MIPLYEKYRPRHLDEVVGQDLAVKRLRIATRQGIAGNAFWIAGPSGMGKTTIAHILANEVAEKEYIFEIDAGDATPARWKDLEYDMHYGAPGKGGRAYIVNESHGLHRDAIRQLLVLLERQPRHTLIIFTTSKVARMQQMLFDDRSDGHPLVSRCIRVDLACGGMEEAFANRVMDIARREELDGGRALEDFIELGERYQWNLRAMIGAVQNGEMMFFDEAAETVADEDDSACGVIMANGRKCPSPVALPNGRCRQHASWPAKEGAGKKRRAYA